MRTGVGACLSAPPPHGLGDLGKLLLFFFDDHLPAVLVRERAGYTGGGVVGGQGREGGGGDAAGAVAEPAKEGAAAHKPRAWALGARPGHAGRGSEAEAGARGLPRRGRRGVWGSGGFCFLFFWELITDRRTLCFKIR
jgi:hypothetical protein